MHTMAAKSPASAIFLVFSKSVHLNSDFEKYYSIISLVIKAEINIIVI